MLLFVIYEYSLSNVLNEPRGKESTEVQITQNKGKESENSYGKLKSSWWTLQFSVRVLTFLSLILGNVLNAYIYVYIMLVVVKFQRVLTKLDSLHIYSAQLMCMLQVRIAAGGLTGLHYALSTFTQLLRLSGSEPLVPVLIQDHPAMQHRAVLLDISPRGRVPSLVIIYIIPFWKHNCVY